MAHLDHGAADPIPISDPDRVIRHVGDGEILAELSPDEIVPSGERLPVLIVGRVISIGGLIGTPMVAAVDLHVAYETERFQHRCLSMGLFEDSGRDGLSSVIDCLRLSHIDGDDLHVVCPHQEPGGTGSVMSRF